MEEFNQQPESNFGSSTEIAELRAQILSLQELIAALDVRVTTHESNFPN